MMPAPMASSMPDAGTRNERAVPFDYSFRFQLDGERQKTYRSTLTVSVEASFNAVSIGYGVVPEVTPVTFGPADGDVDVRGSPLRRISLGALMDRLQTALASAPDAPKDMPAVEAALRNGIRLNPLFAGLALQNDGRAVVDRRSLGQLFQVVGPADPDVQFLYALFDEGSGREFQSSPLLNVAGLGAADGKRPFRHFARPITFAPLATIRMEVTALSDFRGELHVSLHGYKTLGGAPAAEEARRAQRRRR
jgi:hypothetical protein